LVDCFKEDGFSKTFLKPCEKCIEDALESEPDRHSESAGF